MMNEIVFADSIIQWLGKFHLIFIHFPIALIIMGAISEILQLVTKNSQYEFTTKFLLVSAALFCIPAIIFGLALQEGIHISPQNSHIFWWHRTLGIVTLLLNILTVSLSIFSGRHAPYFISFTALVICVFVTAYLGGILAFGPIEWIPA